MRWLGSRLSNALQSVWAGLREWCGDSAYEIYVNAQRRQGCAKMLSAEQFYVEQLDRKYSRPNRCC